MFTPREHKGFSLLEIIVASAMGLLILGVVAKLVIVSTQASNKGMKRVYLQQRLSKLNYDLQRDIGLSSSQGVAFKEDVPQAVSIHRRVVETSTVSWEPHLIVYHAQQETLRRDEAPLGAPPTQPVKPDDWAPLLSSGRTSFIFRGLETFEVTGEPNGLVRIKVVLKSGEDRVSTERLLVLRQGA